MTAENNDSIRIPDAVVQLYWVLRVIGLFIVAVAYFFKHCGIDYRYGGEVDYVAHGSVCADEVYRLVEAHLYRAYSLGQSHFEHHLVGCGSRAKIGEDESVDILAVDAREGVGGVAGFLLSA